MAGLGWLTRALAEVPEDDAWLSEREREILSTLRSEKRHRDWRLGRWTAKAAVATWKKVPPAAVELLAAEDGAPEAFIDGGETPVALSLSHRGGRALVTVSDAPAALGCDLEVLEARSPAFVREWLGADERELVSSLTGDHRDLAANLVWTAKEAASKARREGLRLNIRQATVELGPLIDPGDGWERFRVAWQEGLVELGWWHRDSSWVMAIVSDLADESPPVELH